MAVHCPYMSNVHAKALFCIFADEEEVWKNSCPSYWQAVTVGSYISDWKHQRRVLAIYILNTSAQVCSTLYTYEIHWELPMWFDTKTSSSMSNDANEVFYTCIGVHCTPLFCLVMFSHSFSLHICSICVGEYRVIDRTRLVVQSTQFSSPTYMSHPRTKIVRPTLWSSCYFKNIQCWKQYSPPLGHFLLGNKSEVKEH